MNTTTAILSSWRGDFWTCLSLALVLLCYLRGWVRLRQRGAQHVATWPKLGYFSSGLVAIFLALESPLDALASLSFAIHMTQHLLLILIAPPLLWLGEPQLPLVAGLPRFLRDDWFTPFARSREVHGLLRFFSHPVVTWLAFVGTFWIWHVPKFYDLALTQPLWHRVEHATMLSAALLFWWPVMVQNPAGRSISRWAMVPYLLAAGVQGTVLSGILVFSERVLYATYAAAPRVVGLSPLEDQTLAGALMWVPTSLVLISILGFVVRDAMTTNRAKPKRLATNNRKNAEAAATSLVQLSDWDSPAKRGETSRRVRFDLLRTPLLGPLLSSRWFRLSLRLVMLLLAALIVLDGLTGPQLSPLNLAGVLPWIHWRGILVLGLLVGGNLLCLACPLTLSRRMAKRLFGGAIAWPRALRNKWFAFVLVILFFWSYEAFALWDSPWLTAWITLGYFGSALVVDGIFRGASFCKYVCPVGQFNFVQSLVSPLEVQVRDVSLCQTCTSHACLEKHDSRPHARELSASDAPLTGCQLQLFQPKKASNFDCTWCLDCVHACPHTNIGVLAAFPGETLIGDAPRSGLGRFSRRADIAALVLLLVFAAFVNAAWMVAPVVRWEDALVAALGLANRLPVVTVGMFVVLVAVPSSLVASASWCSVKLGRLAASVGGNVNRFAVALAPLGFGMWLAHYSFHFFTSYDVLLPAVARFAHDWAGLNLGEFTAACSCCAPASWILPVELLMLGSGACVSLYIAFEIARRETNGLSRAAMTFLPWGTMVVLLYAVGVWILLQPMQMRGATLPGMS